MTRKMERISSRSGHEASAYVFKDDYKWYRVSIKVDEMYPMEDLQDADWMMNLFKL